MKLTNATIEIGMTVRRPYSIRVYNENFSRVIVIGRTQTFDRGEVVEVSGERVRVRWTEYNGKPAGAKSKRTWVNKKFLTADENAIAS